MVISGKTANQGQPTIQLIRDSWLKDMGLGDECDACLHLTVSVALSLWVNRYRPSLGLVG
jgi:hypothetical protein